MASFLLVLESGNPLPWRSTAMVNGKSDFVLRRAAVLPGGRHPATWTRQPLAARLARSLNGLPLAGRGRAQRTTGKGEGLARLHPARAAFLLSPAAVQRSSDHRQMSPAVHASNIHFAVHAELRKAQNLDARSRVDLGEGDRRDSQAFLCRGSHLFARADFELAGGLSAVSLQCVLDQRPGFGACFAQDQRCAGEGLAGQPAAASSTISGVAKRRMYSIGSRSWAPRMPTSTS